MAASLKIEELPEVFKEGSALSPAIQLIRANSTILKKILRKYKERSGMCRSVNGRCLGINGLLTGVSGFQ